MNFLGKYGKPLLKYVIGPVVLLWFLFLVMDMMVMPIITRHGEESPLPQVIGKTESEAREILKKQNVQIEVAGREYSSSKPEGIILSQFPEAGMKVKAGRTVKIVVSAGVKITEVPSVAGLPLQEATLVLQKAGFVVGDVYSVRIDSLPENTAVETIPTKGTLLPLGSEISLAVNRTEKNNAVSMPQLVGLPLDRARSILDGLDLVVAEIKRHKDTLYLPNTVLEQKPPKNTTLIRGDSVELTVSETD